MKRIITRQGEATQLAKLFGTSRVMVWHALTFHYNSELCQRIRAAAIARGGKETEYNNN